MKPGRQRRSIRSARAENAQARELERLRQENERLRQIVDEQAKQIAEAEKQIAEAEHQITICNGNSRCGSRTRRRRRSLRPRMASRAASGCAVAARRVGAGPAVSRGIRGTCPGRYRWPAPRACSQDAALVYTRCLAGLLR